MSVSAADQTEETHKRLLGESSDEEGGDISDNDVGGADGAKGNKRFVWRVMWLVLTAEC